MTDARLGKLRVSYLWGRRLYISPDICALFFPTVVTLGLTGATVWLIWNVVSVYELLLLVVLVIGAIIFSALCDVTDPGVIPRSQPPHDTDPNFGNASYRLCDFCNIRRPPRTSHCHVCNVCVLEHDHHCGVIGGCVGLRSLRWFTSYLCCITGATGLGACYLAMSLVELNRFMKNAPKDAAGLMAAHIMLLIFVGNIGLVVGCLAIYYVYLLLTDTTRRESQRGKNNIATSGETASLFRHEHRATELLNHWAWRIFGRPGRVLFPPPSLLDDALGRLTEPERRAQGSDAFAVV